MKQQVSQKVCCRFLLVIMKKGTNLLAQAKIDNLFVWLISAHAIP